MKKYKQVSIFNKNSIFISRIDKPNDDKYVMYKKDQVDLNTGHYSFKPSYYRTEEKEVVKKSNLGFYYKSKVRVHKNTDNQVSYSKTAPLYKTFTFFGSDFVYIIKYPWSYNNATIGTDTRPYDLLDKKGIQDHYLIDLKKELDSIFEICRKEKINQKFELNFNNYTYDKKLKSCDIGEIRCEIYQDIFGDKNGLSIRTDKEKIEAHGFDNKVSFRKDKDE